MEIKIDTKKDSVDDIKKTIDFLMKFVEQDHNSIDEVPTVGEGSFNLFGDNSTLESNDKNDDDEPVTVEEY